MSDTKKINLVSLVGSPFCVAPEDAENVYQHILRALQDGKRVEISFRGVEDLTSLFLNTAIGQLYATFPHEDLRSRLSVVDASPQDLATLKRSVERAKEYAKDPERFHSAAKEMLGDDDDE